MKTFSEDAAVEIIKSMILSGQMRFLGPTGSLEDCPDCEVDMAFRDAIYLKSLLYHLTHGTSAWGEDLEDEEDND